MKGRMFLIILGFVFSWSLFAQDLVNNDEQLKNDIIKVNYTKRNAKLAMVMSAVLPGAGQFYANRKSITTYIFPVLEAGLIYGYVSNVNKGHDLEQKYQDYATHEVVTIRNLQGTVIYEGARYNARAFQFPTQANLIGIHNTDIYDNIYFRWNDDNLEYNQHFYEDIGKYNKYIFGWADWHYIYAYNGTADANPQWVWTADQTVWIGNYPINPDYIVDQAYDEPNSEFRAKYDSMRKDAEAKFDHATSYNFGIVANHLISAMDAIRVTHKINKNYLSQNPIQFNYQTTMFNSHFTPMLKVCKNF